MRLDKYNNPIFNSTDVLHLLYGGDTSILPQLTVDKNAEIENFEAISGIQFQNPIDTSLSIEEYDKKLQDEWFMPSEYFSFNVKEYCLDKCITDEEIQRVTDEFNEFERRNLVRLLQWLKYFVDTCTQNKILWGVGRGSSVASYILYLLGVHKINSIKYNLDWKEFLK